MADKRIQDLTAAGAVALTDLFEISQGGVASRKATGTQIQAAMTGKQDSLPVADTTSIVMGSADGTKQLRFEVDGFTAGATRIATPPNQNFTMAGIDVANVFSSGQTFTPATNTIALNITGVTVTAASSQTFSRIVGTWNTSGTPSAMLINITDSASNAASKMLECQISGNPVFSIGKTGLLNFIDDIRQTFNPGANNSGFNVGSVVGDPASLVNGDLWYESGTNELHARINGATVALGAGGGTPPFIDSTAIIKGSADPTKLFKIEVDGFTTATTRVATPPNQDFTMAGTNVAQTFSVKQTFTPAVNTEALLVTGASSTSAVPPAFVQINGTWNTVGSGLGIIVDVLDTASDVASELLGLRVGSSPQFTVLKDGSLINNGGINAAAGQFAVASDGSFQAAGGPFAVDASSNLTINSVLTFNSDGITITDSSSEFVFSGNIHVPNQITFDNSTFTIADDGTRIVFSSGIQIGTVTVDDDSGALLANTIKAATALQVDVVQFQVSGTELIIVGADDGLKLESGGTFALQDSAGYLYINSGSVRFGIAAASGLLTATHSIRVADVTGAEFDILCKAV